MHHSYGAHLPKENSMDDFYEDDEHVDEVAAAFERGRHGVTGRPNVLNIKATGLELTEDSTGPMAPLRVTLKASGPARPAQAATTAALAAGVTS
jgi:hypothetical protein